jgi:D-lyxose ketol-isomerase
MKRSEINKILCEAEEFLRLQNFHLPPFAVWTPLDWEKKGTEADEIRENRLGWDITDFGKGDFSAFGLVLFTIRNGSATIIKWQKPYAEKILIVQPGQKTPMHYHTEKMEDIINRGGGTLFVQLYGSTPDGKFSSEPGSFSMDGVSRQFRPGEVVSLRSGESITIFRGLYHEFWVEEGTGITLLGEVSSSNDDETDNYFFDPIGRFPEIEEDEEPYRFLCNEYPEAS